MKPRIALVVPYLAGGGGVPAVARFLKDVVLRSNEFELQIVSMSTSNVDSDSVRIAAPASWLRGACTTHGTWEGLPFVNVGVIASEFEFQRYRPRRALTEALVGCDLIQVVCGSPAYANAVIGLGRPVALQVATRARVERRLRDASPKNLLGWWRKAMTEMTDKFDDRALRMVDAIQVENSWMLEYVRELNDGRSVDLRYAPPGVDACFFHPPPNRFSNSYECRYILSVGRFDDERKNVGLLLEAYYIMRQTMDNPPSLKLVGTGDPGPTFWKRVQEFGLKTFVSFHLSPTREDLVGYYQNAVCFALSSDEEGFGVVVIESMACGVPVVATRCGGPDGIISDGTNGYLVSVGDSAMMADRLRRLSEDTAANCLMGMESRRAVESRFAQEVTGEAFLDTYRKLLGRKTMAENY